MRKMQTPMATMVRATSVYQRVLTSKAAKYRNLGADLPEIRRIKPFLLVHTCSLSCGFMIEKQCKEKRNKERINVM
jgi:hypothetical protein